MLTTQDKRLLIVDDDPEFLGILKEVFEAEGYDVTTFDDGPELLEHVRLNGLPHLVLIDLSLPSMHGFELSKELKERGDVPIVFISGEDKLNTVVDAITNYAEDYVVKPIRAGELVARIRRILTRIPDFDYAQTPLVQVDDHLAIDFANNKIHVNDRMIVLTPTEASLLYILMRNAGRVVASDMLIARVWPIEEVYEDTLRVHMHRLRRKLESDSGTSRYIQTERGVGYRFIRCDSAAKQAI
jgi:DNA-binding response OmpR family regulator